MVHTSGCITSPHYVAIHLHGLDLPPVLRPASHGLAPPLPLLLQMDLLLSPPGIRNAVGLGSVCSVFQNKSWTPVTSSPRNRISSSLRYFYSRRLGLAIPTRSAISMVKVAISPILDRTVGHHAAPDFITQTFLFWDGHVGDSVVFVQAGWTPIVGFDHRTAVLVRGVKPSRGKPARAASGPSLFSAWEYYKTSGRSLRSMF